MSWKRVTARDQPVDIFARIYANGDRFILGLNSAATEVIGKRRWVFVDINEATREFAVTALTEYQVGAFRRTCTDKRKSSLIFHPAIVSELLRAGVSKEQRLHGKPDGANRIVFQY